MIVDLFAGPGGWDTGVRQAGYDGDLVGLEKEIWACRTAKAAGHDRLCTDVSVYPKSVFRDVDGLIASPPCQTFSSAGKRAGLDDPRGELVYQPLEWALALKPRWVACEQVPQVLPVWRQTAHELRAHGYSTWVGELNAADFGVPQIRRRAYLIARRDGIPAQPPAATHGQRGGEGMFGVVEPWVTMAEALGWGMTARPSVTVMAGSGRQGGADPLDGGSGSRKALREERETGRWVMMAAGRTGLALPRDPDPSDTITGKGTAAWVHERPATTVQGDPRIGRPGHKDRDKGESQFSEGSVRVTVAEAAALQGFPVDYPWQGPKTIQYQQIGNAVCPPVARAIAALLLPGALRGVA